ncbi:hypothetical protein ANN_22913 [Periplaneta americana]|uniref:Uncharacterized protein n=1 Tax=Periplaneta americana TaxID=6978 RepID=A0ABQ8SJL7_PERAM|nr:hypothetical protein ANN_22913 [Periplaneta americana]
MKRGENDSHVKLCMEESNKCRCMEKYEESQHPLIINKYTENKIPEKIAKLKNRRKEALKESTVTELTNKFKFGSFEGTSKEYYEIKLRNEGLPTRESLYELYKYFCKERDANIAHEERSEMTGKGLSREENSCDISSQTTVILPQQISVLLESISEPCMPVFINLETASQALVCGYLVRVMEEKTSFSSCINNASIPSTAAPLMGLIHKLDKGGLRYPKPDFVSLIITLQKFVESALPYCMKSAHLLQTITNYVLPSLEQCDILKCSNEESHQALVARIVLQKFVKPLLSNIGKRHTNKVFRFSGQVKPLSRKVLKL